MLTSQVTRVHLVETVALWVVESRPLLGRSTDASIFPIFGLKGARTFGVPEPNVLGAERVQA